jgi:hypothetical protein
VGCPRRSRNWTSFSSPWAQAWDGHEVVAALDDKTEAVIRARGDLYHGEAHLRIEPVSGRLCSTASIFA